MTDLDKTYTALAKTREHHEDIIALIDAVESGTKLNKQVKDLQKLLESTYERKEKLDAEVAAKEKQAKELAQQAGDAEARLQAINAEVDTLLADAHKEAEAIIEAAKAESVTAADNARAAYQQKLDELNDAIAAKRAEHEQVVGDYNATMQKIRDSVAA